jgi:hypothetical protein
VSRENNRRAKYYRRAKEANGTEQVKQAVRDGSAGTGIAV